MAKRGRGKAKLRVARKAAATKIQALFRGTRGRISSCSEAGRALRTAPKDSFKKTAGGAMLRTKCGGGMRKGFKYTPAIREAIAARNRRRKDRHEKRFAGVARIARALALD